VQFEDAAACAGGRVVDRLEQLDAVDAVQVRTQSNVPA
jgi:hypothetical protein